MSMSMSVKDFTSKHKLMNQSDIIRSDSDSDSKKSEVYKHYYLFQEYSRAQKGCLFFRVEYLIFDSHPHSKVGTSNTSL